MTTGRRRILLSALFLALTVLVAGGSARAQESHKLWQNRLTPEQIREALARMGAGESGDLDPFQQMVKDYLLKNNPQLDQNQTNDIIKRLTGDKKLMDQLKQYAKQKQTDPGRPGKLNEDDFTKLFDPKQGGKLPDLPPDWNLKGFTPKIDPFKHVDPKVQVDPKVDPKVMPDPKVNPVEDPINKIDPDPIMPKLPELGKQNPEKDTISLDKNPFPEPEENLDARTKSLQAFAAMWERNIGPLSETPEVQKALFDAFNENGLDFDMKDDKGNSIWDLLKSGDMGNSNFGDLFNNPGNMGKWDFGKWDMPKMGDWFGSRRPSDNNSSSWFNSRPSTPRPNVPSSSGWSFGGGDGWSGFGSWLPLIVLLVVVLGLVLWLKLKNLQSHSPELAFVGGNLGAWPVDPRNIKTREEVVLAFEYLSVLICGPSARNWTHSTIAAALSDLATKHEETATMLARLYELARYAPLDEPLTSSELSEARDLVCTLAGVSY